MTTTNYKVGYRRPPLQSRFKPGVSGNPNGRPKNARSFKSDMIDELAELTPYPNGDDTVASITKQRALVKQLVASALAGDARATAVVVAFCTRVLVDIDAEPEAIGADDREILESYGKRANRRADQAEPPTAKGAAQSTATKTAKAGNGGAAHE